MPRLPHNPAVGPQSHRTVRGRHDAPAGTHQARSIAPEEPADESHLLSYQTVPTGEDGRQSNLASARSSVGAPAINASRLMLAAQKTPVPTGGRGFAGSDLLGSCCGPQALGVRTAGAGGAGGGSRPAGVVVVGGAGGATVVAGA